MIQCGMALPKHGQDLRATRQVTRDNHVDRLANGKPPPDIADDPELLAAWNSLQMHWLLTVPGYREVLKARISEARKRQKAMDDRIARQYRKDVDHLGPEAEPCG